MRPQSITQRLGGLCAFGGSFFINRKLALGLHEVRRDGRERSSTCDRLRAVLQAEEMSFLRVHVLGSLGYWTNRLLRVEAWESWVEMELQTSMSGFALSLWSTGWRAQSARLCLQSSTSRMALADAKVKLDALQRSHAMQSNFGGSFFISRKLALGFAGWRDGATRGAAGRGDELRRLATGRCWRELGVMGRGSAPAEHDR